MAAKKSQAGSVLTGDIVQSSGLPPNEKRVMLRILKKLLLPDNPILPDIKAEIFQGDSFQATTISHTMHSLRYALHTMAILKKNNIAARISLGIGEIDFVTQNVTTSNGIAFQYSGRGLEELKKKSGSFIAIQSDKPHMNPEFEVHCITIDYLLARCTPLQAEALALALENLTQMQIAKKLKLSQPAVQQRLQAAGWPVFKSIIQRFESLLIQTT